MYKLCLFTFKQIVPRLIEKDDVISCEGALKMDLAWGAGMVCAGPEHTSWCRINAEHRRCWHATRFRLSCCRRQRRVQVSQCLVKWSWRKTITNMPINRQRFTFLSWDMNWIRLLFESRLYHLLLTLKWNDMQKENLLGF